MDWYVGTYHYRRTAPRLCIIGSSCPKPYYLPATNHGVLYDSALLHTFHFYITARLLASHFTSPNTPSFRLDFDILLLPFSSRHSFDKRSHSPWCVLPLDFLFSRQQPLNHPHWRGPFKDLPYIQGNSTILSILSVDMPIPALLPTPPSSPHSTGFPSTIPNDIKCPEDRIGWVLGDWLELLGVRGLGAYGAVYTAVDIRNNTPLAVKALVKARDARQYQFQRREIQLHHAVSHHPNVVSLYRIMETDDTVFVVLELCTGGDLFSNITEKRLYQDNDALIKHTFIQVCEAVHFCHEVGVYHRDLKPENVLISHDGSVKLADFGLATRDPRSDDFGCGSTFYMSPGKLSSFSPISSKVEADPHPLLRVPETTTLRRTLCIWS